MGRIIQKPRVTISHAVTPVGRRIASRIPPGQCSTFQGSIPQGRAKGQKEIPRIPQDGPKRAQDGPKRAQEGAKMTPGWLQDSPGWRQDGPRMAPRVPKGGKRRRIRIGSDSDHNRIRLETDRGPTMARQGGPEVKMTSKMDPKMDPKTLPKVIPKLIDFWIPIGKPFWCSWRSHGSQGWPQVGTSRPAESA